jgi:hypothetical protein
MEITQPSEGAYYFSAVCCEVLNLVSRFKIVVRIIGTYRTGLRARAVYLFSHGISRAEFSLGNRY